MSLEPRMHIIIRHFLFLSVIYLSLHIFSFAQSSENKEILADDYTISSQRDKSKPQFCSVRPKIVSRQNWGAKNPTGFMKKHEPLYITIHHTDVEQQKNVPIDQKMLKLQEFSQRIGRYATGGIKPAWPDVSYHFYIDPHGQIAEGRNMEYSGDTGTNYDPNGHILIALEGNFEKEQPSPNQLQSLENLTCWLTYIWNITPSNIKGHKDYANTSCPGENLEDKIPELRRRMADHLNRPISINENTR